MPRVDTASPDMERDLQEEAVQPNSELSRIFNRAKNRLGLVYCLDALQEHVSHHSSLLTRTVMHSHQGLYEQIVHKPRS